MSSPIIPDIIPLCHPDRPQGVEGSCSTEQLLWHEIPRLRYRFARNDI